MNRLEKEIIKEKKKSEVLLQKVNTELDQLNSEHARIKVSAKGKFLQLYIWDEGYDGTNGRYLSKVEKGRAVNIVQGEYYRKLKVILEKRLRLMDRILLGLKNSSISDAYKLLGKGKQRLVDPIEVSDERYRKEWEQCEYTGKEFEENATEIYTDRGERVRSKSEKIIADKLFKENIAYRYEYPLDVVQLGTFYPDFTILDEVNRRNIIFEHFGLMDNEEYANNAVSKIQIYSRAGYVLGDNLYITMETSTKPLDSRMLEGIIKQIKS